MEAVLFDMDGTLVDTEPYWMDSERALVAAHGGSWSDAQSRACIGNPLMVSATRMRDDGGVDLPAEEIVKRLLDEVTDLVRGHVLWQPGTRELLADLRPPECPAGS